MTDALEVRRGSFVVGSQTAMSDEQVSSLVSLISSSDSSSQPPSDHLLGGRGIMIRASVPGLNEVVVKRYRRGGFLKYVVHDRYIRFGRTRSQAEYEVLAEVRALGVNAPRPMAYIHTGLPLYSAWLVMEEVAMPESLIDVGLQDEGRAMRLLEEVTRQVAILIRNRIYHIDLHPGNIVIGPGEKVYLVDFDKAYRFKGSKNDLRDRYLRRWRRAVIKHGLPEILSETVCLRLREDYERSTE